MTDRWIILGILAIVLFGAGSLFGKIASENDIPSRVYFFEALGTLSVFTLFFVFKKSEILNNFSFNRHGLLMGLCWGLGTVMFITALDRSKLSVLVPLTALYPAVTILLAFLFLGEKLNMREIAGVTFALVALFLLVK